MQATGNAGTSVNLIQVGPLGYFAHVSITTPIARALKNYSSWGFLEVSTDILSHFRIQMAVSLPKPPYGGFGSETAVTRRFRPFPNGHKRPFGCNGYVTAVAVGQRQRLYSGVRMYVCLPGIMYYLSSF